jgi:Fe-S cluster assembly protein SufD
MTNLKLSPTIRQTGPKSFHFSESQILNNAENKVRKTAFDVLNKTTLPDTSVEAWRRTDLKSFPIDLFKIFTTLDEIALPQIPKEILEPMVDDKFGGQIITTPFSTTIALDEDIKNSGVIFTDIKTAETKYPDQLKKILGTLVNPEESIFAALSASLAQTGVFIYVPKNVKVEKPLHSIFWAGGNGLAFISNILVYLEENASLTFVHESASPKESEDQILSSNNIEINLSKGAQLRFVELQSWGKNVWNFSHERSRVEEGANLDWIIGSLGSRLTKNFSDIDLVGVGATGRMSGFYITDNNQHIDHDTQQNHFAGKTTSDLLFKGALLDHSRSVWQGMIYVAPDAQQSDGYQANRNLILSEHARADSIPGLEILADDVRCTHGATVGKLEAEPIFYLKSRGIPQAEAEKLVVEGFFDPIMQRIPFQGVRDRFKEAIINKMTK